jgi:hypothetical protein
MSPFPVDKYFRLDQNKFKDEKGGNNGCAREDRIRRSQESQRPSHGCTLSNRQMGIKHLLGNEEEFCHALHVQEQRENH